MVCGGRHWSCAPFCFAFGTTGTALAEQRVERALSVTVSQPEPRLAQEDNTETGAWITVPGTNIDAPVQQASDNDYYLRRDTAGNADVHGCVFADYACDLNSTSLSRNLVLYGHTFEDGYEGGFKALHNYEQDSFAEEHPYIYLSLPDAALTYRVVSAGVCSAADDRDCIEPNPVMRPSRRFWQRQPRAIRWTTGKR